MTHYYPELPKPPKNPDISHCGHEEESLESSCGAGVGGFGLDGPGSGHEPEDADPPGTRVEAAYSLPKPPKVVKVMALTGIPVSPRFLWASIPPPPNRCAAKVHARLVCEEDVHERLQWHHVEVHQVLLVHVKVRRRGVPVDAKGRLLLTSPITSFA